MIYQQAFFMNPERQTTALALMKEHFERVRQETGCEFGDIHFEQPSYVRPGLKRLCAHAELRKPMERASFFLSETEAALIEGMWSTLH